MDNKLYNTIQELERSIQSVQEEVKRQCTSPSVNPINVFQSELNYKMQQYVYNLPSYLNFDQVLGFPIQPISYSSETNVSDRGISIRVAIHHYPPVKPMIIKAPEMILELLVMVDSSGRMEYQFSNYFANPEDLNALAHHLPEGSCLMLQSDGSLSIEALEEPSMESSWGFSAQNQSLMGESTQSVGDGFTTFNEGNSGGGLDGMDYVNNTASLTGTLVGGAQFAVGAVENQSLWNASYKARGALKSVGVNVQTRAIKQGAKGLLKNAGRKITYVGGVLAIADVAIDGELRASHLLNAGMVGVSAIPVVGWVIGGTYFVSDMITIGVSGQSIGQHLDDAVGAPLVNDIYAW
ncbi:MAG: hypothetical protein COC06_10450 [Bacteroidales bacterium]|nr:MAG: hypothetical protein COC06_10450 [Bacteroidales bacterium]